MNAIAVQIFDILKMTIILDNEHGTIKVKWKGEIHHKILQSAIFHSEKKKKKEKHINILKQLWITGTIFHNQLTKQVVSYFG